MFRRKKLLLDDGKFCFLFPSLCRFLFDCGVAGERLKGKQETFQSLLDYLRVGKNHWSVLLGRDGMNNNFNFKTNPSTHDLSWSGEKQTKTTETRFSQLSGLSLRVEKWNEWL